MCIFLKNYFSVQKPLGYGILSVFVGLAGQVIDSAIKLFKEGVIKMKRRYLMAAMMCTFCLTAATVAPAMAEETTEAVTEAEETTEAEAGGEESTEGSTEVELELAERPDYSASDYVTLGEYKGLKVELEPIQVTDEELQDEVRYNVQLADALEEFTEGAVEMGDTANIDYEGKLDGVAFDGGTAKGYDLIIGSDSFIDGFEDGLVGVKVGDTVDLPLSFPENYYSDELAGKDVVFTVKVNSVKRMPELTDELVNTITDGEYTDVASYQDHLRTQLLEDKESQKDSEILNNLMVQVANSCTINEYPQEMVDYGMTNMENSYRQYAQSYNMEYADFLEAYLGMTEESFKEAALEAVKQNLQQELYLKAIAEAENMEVSDEEYQEGCQRFADQYGYSSGDELEKDFGEGTIRISILQEKVMNFLKDNAVIEEIAEAESEAGAEAETDAE